MTQQYFPPRAAFERPPPKGTVYLKVVTDQGAVETNGTLYVNQWSTGTLNYCISMSDVNGTGYVQLAPVDFNGARLGFITSGYYNVTQWAGSYNNSIVGGFKAGPVGLAQRPRSFFGLECLGPRVRALLDSHARP
jgi:hypothetical protein